MVQDFATIHSINQFLTTTNHYYGLTNQKKTPLINQLTIINHYQQY